MRWKSRDPLVSNLTTAISILVQAAVVAMVSKGEPFKFVDFFQLRHLAGTEPDGHAKVVTA